MPELPEVHTISKDLNSHIKGYTITYIRIIDNYKVKPNKKIFLDKTHDQRIEEVFRVAKNIIFKLSSGNYLLVHLAMTGQVLLLSQQQDSPKWSRVILNIVNNSDRKTIFLTDMRKFGKIAVINEKELEDLKKKYGPEPISEITAEEFHKQIKLRKTVIKNALLDQKVVSGLGNIYATDALFLAEIHPETPTQNISLKDSEKLLRASKQVLLEGINNRGSTLKDKMYIDIFGKEGSHQNHFKIYGKSECPNCGTPTITKKVAGRGTYFCPSCQILQ